MSGQRIAINADSFGQFRVKELSEGDFWLGSSTPIALKSGKCHIVLFYEPSSTDPDLIEIWQDLARTIAGPVIAAVNTSARGEIMDAFMAVGADIDNPLYDFTGFGVPTILVYRNRWPQAFYNGELSYDAIKKWILVLACRPGYHERESLWSGVRSVENEGVIVREPRVAEYAYPTSSRDFTSTTGEEMLPEEEAPAPSDGEEPIPASEDEVSPEEPTPAPDDVGFLDE